MNKDLCLLLTESEVGIHYKDGNASEVYEVFSLTFPIKVKKELDEYFFNCSLEKNKVFQSVIERYQEAKGSYTDISILIGFDYDRTGELMSHGMRESLLVAGVSTNDIFRTPLTEKGYICGKPFAKQGSIKRILFFQQKYSALLRENKIRKSVGFLKSIALKFSQKHKGKKFNLSNSERVDKKGTSTITYLYKLLLGDR